MHMGHIDELSPGIKNFKKKFRKLFYGCRVNKRFKPPSPGQSKAKYEADLKE